MKTRGKERPHQKQSKNKPNKLHIRTKLEIITRLKSGEKPTQIASFYKINESTVRYIRKNQNLIMRKGQVMGFPLPELPINKPKEDSCQVKMEQLLKEWIELHKVSLAHRELICEKAQVFYRLIRKENGMEDQECELVNSGRWFKTFKNRFLRNKMKEVNSVAKTVLGTKSTKPEREPKKVPASKASKAKLKVTPVRNILPFSERLKLVHKLEEGLDPLNLARLFNVSLSTVKRVALRAAEIKKQGRKIKAGPEEKTSESVVEIKNVDKMEALLKCWIKKHGISLEVEDVVLRKAGSLYRVLQKKNKSDGGEFEPNTEWLQGFKERFEQIEESFDETVPETRNVENDLSITNAPSPLERLQANNKPQSSPATPTNSHPKQENRVSTPQNNDAERDPDEVCLRWNSHHSNMKTSFPTLLEKEQYVDVTLCSEGQTIRCHKLILSSCSSYFDEILSGITPLQHPVIFLNGTPFWILKSLIDFMYVGEVHIEQAKLQEILDVAELLKIKGLTGKSTKSTTPKEETPTLKEKVSTPVTQSAKTQSPQKTPLAAPSLTIPMKFVTKEQAAKMQIVDPLSLLKPSHYEEHGLKKLPMAIRPKPQSLAEFSAKQKEWLSKKIIPKKKLKRKSTDHDPSPPPVILRKGTKSRPIVKAPKYYHMEYERKKDNSQTKEEEESEESESPNSPPPPPQQEKTKPPVSVTTTIEPTFDLANVKSEPVEVDIEENDMDYGDNDTAALVTSTPTIRITEPRTVSADESNIFLSNPHSPEHPPIEGKEVNEDNAEENSNVNGNEAKGDNDEAEGNKSPTLEPDPEPESSEKEPGEIDVSNSKPEVEDSV